MNDKAIPYIVKLTIPCIDCITLSVCKGIISEIYLKYPDTYVISRLCKKCSLIKEYASENKPYLNRSRCLKLLYYLRPNHNIIG